MAQQPPGKVWFLTLDQAVATAKALIDNLVEYGAQIERKPLVYLQAVTVMSGIDVTKLHSEVTLLTASEMALLTPTIIAQRLAADKINCTNKEVNCALESLGLQQKIYGLARLKQNGQLGKAPYDWALTEQGTEYGKLVTGAHSDTEHTKTGLHNHVKWFETVIPLIKSALIGT